MCAFQPGVCHHQRHTRTGDHNRHTRGRHTRASDHKASRRRGDRKRHARRGDHKASHPRRSGHELHTPRDDHRDTCGGDHKLITSVTRAGITGVTPGAITSNQHAPGAGLITSVTPDGAVTRRHTCKGAVMSSMPARDHHMRHVRADHKLITTVTHAGSQASRQRAIRSVTPLVAITGVTPARRSYASHRLGNGHKRHTSGEGVTSFTGGMITSVTPAGALTNVTHVGRSQASQAREFVTNVTRVGRSQASHAREFVTNVTRVGAIARVTRRSDHAACVCGAIECVTVASATIKRPSLRWNDGCLG
jgi:hypothetical protein